MASYLQPSAPELPPCATTIGFFDGVHTGHLDLLRQLACHANSRSLVPVITTFATHPRAVTRAQPSVPELLTTTEEKLALLRQTQPYDCLLLPFDRAVASLSAQEFMAEYLAKRRVKLLLMGYNHRFGSFPRGDLADYIRYGAALGIEVIEGTAHTVDGQPVSSSLIRQRLQSGDLLMANKLLGYPYFLTATVVRGAQKGRTLGFPTANLGATGKLLPANGVYAVKVTLADTSHTGVLNIGYRPTLADDRGRHAEVHILDYRGDLYNKEITVHFASRIRDERRFDSLAALQQQIARDIEVARSVE